MRDSWQEIGSVLKKKRESLGYDIKHVAFNVGISMHRIRYMEEGRFDEVDDPIYVRTYIKRYANFLGLDGEELARRYWNTITGKKEKEPSQIQRQEPEIKSEWGLEGIPVFIVFLYVVLVVEIAIALVLYGHIMKLRNTPDLVLKNTSGNTIEVNGEPLKDGEVYVIEDEVEVRNNKGTVLIRAYSGKSAKIKMESFRVVMRGGFGKTP